MKVSRRNVLRWAGVSLALPTVLSGRAFAATTRKRFIGVYFPNGAYMPMGANGNWNFAEALQPLAAAGFQQNTVIVRGLFNGFGGVDPHWQNTAAFLSCKPILLGDPGVTRCGKSIDQYVADLQQMPLRSLEVGAPYYHIHPLADHPGYSNDYMNRISWQTDDKSRSPIPDPKQMFEKLFSSGPSGPNTVAYLHARKKSILDHLHKDATRTKANLPASYGPVLDSYMDTVREVERELTTPPPMTCTPGFGMPTEDFSGPDKSYVRRYQLMNQMVVLAMQCGLTNAATFMYGPSSSFLTHVEPFGSPINHHGAAHNKGDAALIARVKQICQLQMGFVADLLTKLNTANLLDETLVIAGSDMSDGDVHLERNLPVVVCGKGPDIKWGQEIGDAATPRPLSDLHVELLQLMGVPGITSFGAGVMASTGMPTGIRV